MQDGSRRQLNVQGSSNQAEDLSIPPVAGGELDGSKGHDHHGNQQVRKRQRHDEVVGLFLPERRQQDQADDSLPAIFAVAAAASSSADTADSPQVSVLAERHHDQQVPKHGQHDNDGQKEGEDSRLK